MATETDIAGGARGRSERVRLQGIGKALASILGPHEIKRDWIWPNVPPAWVHHVRFNQPLG